MIKLLDGTELGPNTTQGRCGDCPFIGEHKQWGVFQSCTKFTSKYGSLLTGKPSAYHRLDTCREAEGQPPKVKNKKPTKTQLKSEEE